MAWLGQRQKVIFTYIEDGCVLYFHSKHLCVGYVGIIVSKFNYFFSFTNCNHPISRKDEFTRFDRFMSWFVCSINQPAKFIPFNQEKTIIPSIIELRIILDTRESQNEV